MTSIEYHSCPLCQEGVPLLGKSVQKHRGTKHKSVPLGEFLNLFCKELCEKKTPEGVPDIKEEAEEEEEDEEEGGGGSGLCIVNVTSLNRFASKEQEPECITLDDSSVEEEEQDPSSAFKGDQVFACPQCKSGGKYFTSLVEVSEHIRKVHA